MPDSPLVLQVLHVYTLLPASNKQVSIVVQEYDRKHYIPKEGSTCVAHIVSVELEPPEQIALRRK